MKMKSDKKKLKIGGKKMGKVVIAFMVGILICSVISAQNNEDVYNLIKGLDAEQMEDRNKAYDKLLELSKQNKDIFEIVKKESENPQQSYHTRYLLKKIIGVIEGKKSEEEKGTAKGSGGSSTITLPIGRIKGSFIIDWKKPYIGVMVMAVKDKGFLDYIEKTFDSKYSGLDEFIRDVGLDEAKGLFVVDIEKNSPADGTLKVGDIILELDGREVNDASAFSTTLKKEYKPGQKITLKILRNKKPVEVNLTLGAKEEDGITDIEDIENEIGNIIKDAIKEKEAVISSGSSSSGPDSKDKLEDRMKEVEDKIAKLEKHLEEISKKLDDISKKLGQGGK